MNPSDPPFSPGAERLPLFSDDPPSLLELCERHHNDNEHSFFVAELSREIFLRTEAIHGLDRRWLPVLEAGAQLHNLGLFYGVRRHHVRGMELILERGVAGFSPEEIALIALCARFHRKRVRAEEVLLYRALPAELQKVALRLAAIVRVADGLDSSQDRSARLNFYDDTRRRVRFYVGGNAAAENARRATAKADLWNQTMPRPVRFVPDDGSRKFYLRRGDRMQAAGYKVFSVLFEQVLAHEPGARRGTDPEELHQLRVNLRRLRAAFRAFRKSFGRELLDPIEEDVKSLLDATNRARDLDVFRTFLQEAQADARAPLLLDATDAARKEAYQVVRDALDGLTYRFFRERFPHFLQAVHPYERPIQRKWAQRRARKGARRLIAQELERVLLQGIGLDWEQPEQLHRLRIALKRLRYTVDLFGDLLDGGRSPIIRPLKRLQDGFGAVQDAEVHLRLLQELTARLRAERPDACQEETTTWDHLRGLLNARRTAALGEARAQWERFCAPEFLERIAQTYRLNLSAHQDSLQEATAP